MAQIEQSDNGKKKKGAQKKKSIHVDFTPMVDMNMLLITFFMLCTTMIKPQTLNIALPSNEKSENADVGTKADQRDAITLILDTERDENGNIMSYHDPVTGQDIPNHIIYYYQGKPLDDKEDGTPSEVKDFETQQLINGTDTTMIFTDKAFVANKVKMVRFRGNDNSARRGVRLALYNRNQDVLNKIDSIKKIYETGGYGTDKDASKARFEEEAARVRGAKKDTLNNEYDYSAITRPVIIIKPGPNASYENVVKALDEMQINQIGQYQINTINAMDSLWVNSFKYHQLEEISDGDLGDMTDPAKNKRK